MITIEQAVEYAESEEVGGRTDTDALVITVLADEVEWLRRLFRGIGDHPQVMAQSGTDNADRACRVINKLEAEVGRLHTWDGLMSLLDEHYPADVPLVSDPANGPGPRLVATIREVDQLREALRPFADVAKGIPDNWPGECRVRVDIGLVQEWLSYYEAGTPNATFPTIAEWRAVLATQQPEGEGGK